MSVYLLVVVFLIHNTIPIILGQVTKLTKIIKELSTIVTQFEKRQYKHHGTLSGGRQIEYYYYTKHGITKEQDLLISQKILDHSYYTRLFDKVVSLTELNKI